MFKGELSLRNLLYVFFFMSFLFLAMGCEGTNEHKKEISTMTEEELYDIYYIKEAPKAIKNHDLSEVIKLVLTKNEDLTDETIAIDVEKNGIYIDPSIQLIGVRALKGMKEIDDIQKVIDILEKYHVQGWKEDYSTKEAPSSTDAGVGWSMYIQFENGSVKHHMGSGTSMESVTPEGFAEFFNELETFVNDQI